MHASKTHVGTGRAELTQCGGAKTRIFVSQIDGFIISKRSGTCPKVSIPTALFCLLNAFFDQCVLRPPRPRWQRSNAPPPPGRQHHHTPRPGRGEAEGRKRVAPDSKRVTNKKEKEGEEGRERPPISLIVFSGQKRNRM